MATDDARHPVSADAMAFDGDTDEFSDESPTLPIRFEPMAVTDERCRTGRAGMEELDAVSAAVRHTADSVSPSMASAAVDKQPTAMLLAASQEDSGAKVS
jgi:hypothetical protein